MKNIQYTKLSDLLNLDVGQWTINDQSECCHTKIIPSKNQSLIFNLSRSKKCSSREPQFYIQLSQLARIVKVIE